MIITVEVLAGIYSRVYSARLDKDKWDAPNEARKAVREFTNLMQEMGYAK